ncbi:flagellar motor protein MotB [Aquibacillus kalidii]|uniref:flagellar motor protein MotB n=1 Tax=Aquibacillus kalidii TaxID=2762597 RepID=UPI001646C384|nr:flagellar motor protein MotB [Aquibacillus kalidii]
MSRKKKQHDEHHVDESWLIPYADMLTLLLALFIVLFAMSDIDAQKYQALSQVMKSEFAAGGEGIMEHRSSPVESPKESITDMQNDEEMEEPVEISENDATKSEQELNQLEQLQQEINNYIDENNLSAVLGTRLTDEGLMVAILNDVFFDSGSAVVKGDGKEIAKEMSDILYTEPPHQIIVSGHTDNQPIQNSQYKSNWDLSVMRAVNFMRLVLTNSELDPQKFSAMGYGEYKPIAPNDTDSNRAKNRRVELLILPNYKINTGKE